jgi:hypothetical protein
MIDYDMYPDIVDSIVGFANHKTLLELRTTSRALRDTADRVLYEHIVVAGLLPDTTKSLLSPLGDRLPVLPELLQPCPDEAEDKIEEAGQLLAKARLIDFVVPPGPRAKMAEGGWRNTPLIRAMDRARPGTRPCAFRVIVSGGYDRAISVLQWPASTHTAIDDFFTRLSAVPTAVGGFWHYSPAVPTRFAFELAVGPPSRLTAVSANLRPHPSLFHSWRTVRKGAPVVVHFTLLGGGYTTATNNDLGVVMNIVPGIERLPLSMFLLVGLDEFPAEEFGPGGLPGDWPSRQQVLYQRLLAAVVERRTRIAPMRLPPDALRVRFLTRDQYRHLVGEKRLALETERPASFQDPADGMKSRPSRRERERERPRHLP